MARLQRGDVFPDRLQRRARRTIRRHFLQVGPLVVDEIRSFEVPASRSVDRARLTVFPAEGVKDAPATRHAITATLNNFDPIDPPFSPVHEIPGFRRIVRVRPMSI